MVGVVGGPARVVRPGPGQLDGAEHVGAEVLHRLERADRAVELASLLRVLDGHLERPRRGADAVDDRRDPEAVDGLCDRARCVARAEPACGNFGERDRGELARPVDGRRGRDRETRRIAHDDERAELALR